MVLLHSALLNPVLGENPEDLCQFLHSLRDWNVNDLLHSPLLHHLRLRNIENLILCTLQDSVLA